MLDTVPLRNVRGLGGKLGEVVESWSKAKTVSDLKVGLSSGVTIHGCRTTTTVVPGPYRPQRANRGVSLRDANAFYFVVSNFCLQLTYS